MVKLPNEIIHAIIHEYKQTVWWGHLRPLAAINRNWEIVVEDYIWNYLRIAPQDIGRFHSVFHENPRRKRSLKILDIYLEGYFAKGYVANEGEEQEGTDEESSDESDDTSQPVRCDSEGWVWSWAFGKDRRADYERQTPLMRLTAFQNEHARFFRQVKPIWDELASWKDDLQLTDIYFHVNGYSICDFLGSDVCDGEYFGDSTLLDSTSFPALPSLLSVKHLWVREETNQETDLWPAIVTCSVASSLPMLERLRVVGVERELRWPLVRIHLRRALASQIRNLPASLKTLYLCLEHGAIQNHEIQPPNFLVGNQDYLSKSIHHISTHLTTLAIRLSYISAALFWDPDVSSSGSCASIWPNLRILDISTGIERPSGDYWLRSAADYPHHERYDFPDPEDSDSDDSNTEMWRLAGAWPERRSRTRPEPEFFDELAISIARAAAGMPKLEYLDLEFNASHQGVLDPPGASRHYGFRTSIHQYEGWAFYYRASNKARFASEHPKIYQFEHEPGLDRTEIECPRTEWVFQCPYWQVQWNEPEAAKKLWREKFPNIDFNLVALDDGGRSWERRRGEDLIPLLGEKFMTKFPGRHDLVERTGATD